MKGLTWFDVFLLSTVALLAVIVGGGLLIGAQQHVECMRLGFYDVKGPIWDPYCYVRINNSDVIVPLSEARIRPRR